MEELKPCPFCKENNPIIYKDLGKYAFVTFYIQCWACSCRTDYYPSEKEAIERWNRRRE